MTPALSCPVCAARGYLGERRCPNCRGAAFVQFVGNTLVGWRTPLDPFAIALRRAGARANRIVNGVLIGIAAVAVGERLIGIFISPPFSPSFATGSARPSLLGFWIGAFALFLFIARRRRARYATVPIPRRGYDEEAPAIRTPSGWEEARAVPAHEVRDAAASFTPAALRAAEEAVALAERAGHTHIVPLHLFAAFLPARETAVFFARAGVARSAVEERVERALGKLPSEAQGAAPLLSAEAQAALVGAYARAAEGRAALAGIEELIVAVSDDPRVAEILDDVGITPAMVGNIASWLTLTRALRERIARYRTRAAQKPTGALDRAMTAVATPTLDRFGRDLTRAARFGRLPFMVERDAEMRAIFRAIEGGRSSVILVGEPGVGKDAIVSGLAERMVTEEVPELLADKRLVALSIPDLVAGASPAEAGERLLTALNEVARARNIALAVENIDALVGIAEGGADLFDIFAEEAGRGYFYCLATATTGRYTEAVERRPSSHAFTKVEIAEPTGDQAVRIIMALVGRVEAEQGVFFAYPALRQAVTLSARYLPERRLPEKAIEVLRESAQAVRTSRGQNALVDGEDVAAIVSEKSHVPVTAVTEEETDKLLALEGRIHERVIGQDEAVAAVAAALRRARAELRAQNRPIASFLFLGPTGVGKTELAKTVSAVYFGAEDAMVRLDMSEYQEASAIRRLIGSPGERGGGLLTEAVRKKPFTLLLLDEFEKAHADILNVFLQVMEDGRLTDNEGRTADFTNVIIVATSNAGSAFIQDAIRAGRPPDEVKNDLLLRELKGVFRPELLNRFDGVIVFRPLTADQIEQIAWLMMGKITDLLAGRGITFRATDEAVKELASIGFDPVFGARPMRRVLQEKVENALADALLRQKLGRRDTVVLDPGGVIRIEKAKEL